MRPIGPSELLEPTHPDDARSRAAGEARRRRCASACACATTGPTRTIAPQGTLVERRRRASRSQFAASDGRAGADRRRSPRSVVVAEPGAVVARPPQPLHAVARRRPGEQLLRARRPAPADLARRAHAAQRPAPAAARRVDPGGRQGHGDALTPGRPGRARRRAARRSAPTPCARSTRSNRRCSNASTPPASSCGRASARSKAPASGTRPRRRC